MTQLKQFFAWCTLINFIILAVWALMLFFAKGWLFDTHGNIFHLSSEQLATIHYCGLGIYKLGIILFNLVPYMALRTIEKRNLSA